MKHLWIGAAILVGPLLAGCAADIYSQSAREGEFQPAREYAAHLAKEPTGRAPAGPGKTLEAVRQRIGEEKKKWEQVLAGDTGRFAFIDFSSPEFARHRGPLSGKAYGTVFEGSFTLEQTLAAAYLHNPGVAAKRLSWRAALEKFDQVTRLDTLVREYAAILGNFRVRVGTPVGKEMVARMHPAPAILALRGSITDADIRIARETYRIAVRDLVRDVRKAYADLVYLGEAVAVTREVLALMGKFEAVVRTLFAGGTARQGMLLMAQMEVAKLKTRLIVLAEKKSAVAGKMNQLLGREAHAVLGQPAAFPRREAESDLAVLLAAARSDRQEVRRAKIQVVRMTRLVELAEQMSSPDLTLGLGYLGVRTGQGGKDGEPPFPARPMVMPKGAYATTRAFLDEVRTRLDAARETVRVQEDKAAFLVQKAWSALTSARETERLYRESLGERARQAFDAQLAGYRTGRVSFTDVVDAARTLLQIRLGESAAGRDAFLAWAELERAVGAGTASPKKGD